MAFTYDLTTNRGKIRLAVGDTIDRTSVDLSLTDAEIDHSLTISSDLNQASMYACEFLIAKTRHWIDQNQKGVGSSASQKLSNLLELYKLLKERAAQTQMTCFFGGISDSRRDTINSDSDFSQPNFKLGQDDNPSATASDDDDND